MSEGPNGSEVITVAGPNLDDFAGHVKEAGLVVQREIALEVVKQGPQPWGNGALAVAHLSPQGAPPQDQESTARRA